MTYKPIEQRNVIFSITDSKLIADIEKKNSLEQNDDIEAVILKSLEITSKHLNFTMSNKNEINPNKLIETKNAHCIGYSSFYIAVIDNILKRKNLEKEWIITHNVGQLYIFSFNIHNYINSSFFKDHDFVTIKNKRTQQEYSIDPTLYDYTGIVKIKTNVK